MRVCLFCGSSGGQGPRYLEAARAFGRGLAEANIGLVYGGASIGLMGAAADAALAAGGEVIGVIPRHLQTREIAHRGLTRLDVTESMHARKARMLELSDAFVALPGGTGTMDELFEVWTWAQLGLHTRPMALVNLDGFYDAFVGLIGHMEREGFMRAEATAGLAIDATVAETLDRMIVLSRSARRS